MKEFITLLLIVLALTCYPQSGISQSSNKSERDNKNEIVSLSQMQKDADLIPIEPKLVDEFIEAIKSDNMDKVWSMVDEDVQKMQPKDNMIQVFVMYNKYFGRIINYEQTSFGMYIKGSFGQLATVEYDVKFENYSGKGHGVFKVHDTNTVKMFSFNLSLDDYTTVSMIDSIAQSSMDVIKAKRKIQLYNLTSTRFKEYVPLAEFDSMVTQIFLIDIKDYRMYQHQLGIIDGNEVVAVYYEINNKEGYLQLSFTKSGDFFELEGINYSPNK